MNAPLPGPINPKPEHDCPHCDFPGSAKTYANQVGLPIRGRVRSIDHCIHRLVAALNAGNIETVASCCGHRKLNGLISLEDGRDLVIVTRPNNETNDQYIRRIRKYLEPIKTETP